MARKSVKHTVTENRYFLLKTWKQEFLFSIPSFATVFKF